MGLRTKWRPGDAFLLRHKDANLLVVEKKAGMLTHAGPEQDEPSLLGHLRSFLDDRSPRRHLRAVHRLDRVVSGLLVFSRTERAFSDLRSQFAARSVERLYLAGVRGIPESTEGTFVDHLDVEPLTVRVTDESREGARKAVTHWQRQDVLPEAKASLLHVRLETGLRNQIRVQLAAHGFPLLGERKYDPDQPRGQGQLRIFLHAGVLGFRHPISGEPLRFEATPPPDLMRWTAALRRGPTLQCPRPMFKAEGRKSKGRGRRSARGAKRR